jgi:ligand-binding sensor protein
MNVGAEKQKEGEQMTLMELKSKEEWESILDRFSRDANMTACLIDDTGKPLLCRFDRYPLCQSIRDSEEAATFICSQINISMLAVVKKTRRPEVDVCDAGLLRVVVPIFQDGALVGQIAACGLASEDEELGSFVVAKQLGISEERVKELARSTPFGSEEELQQLAARLYDEVNEETN